MSNFDRAFRFLIGEEGGYSADPHDPGGETKFGISKRAYPQLDIKSLTLDQAKAIYRRDYWDRLQLDARKYGPALVLCGPTRVRHLVVEGRQVVRDGQMVTLDLPRVLERQRRMAVRLAG